jgi:hypothetical protein
LVIYAPIEKVVPEALIQLRACSSAYKLLKQEEDKDKKENKPNACCAASECGGCTYLSLS